MNRWAVAIFGAVAAAACASPRQATYPEASFPPPGDTILTPYVNVPVGAWLGGRRWVVVANEFDEAALLDFAARSRRTLNSPGLEVKNPFGVFATGDTAWVTDWALRRATRWTADGRPAGAIPAPDPLVGALPAARDAAGRFYFEVKPEPRRDGSGNRDSAAIVRADAALARFDTVGRLSPLDLAEVRDRGTRRFERRVFSGQDRWGVLPDGVIWIARVFPNRVVWIGADGRQVRGQDLPDRVYEVTNADREHFLLQFPEELRTTAERLPFAPIKPPFENAIAGADGAVWLEKSRAAIDSVRRYHVVDRAGRLARIVVLPSRQGHVIAVGDSLALVAEQWLEGVRLMEVRLPR
jgi:hypothetical protein